MISYSLSLLSFWSRGTIRTLWVIAHVMSCDALNTMISLAVLVVLDCLRGQVVQVCPNKIT